MANKLMQARVRKLLDYRKGKLYWKVFRSGKNCVGKEAGFNRGKYQGVAIDDRLYSRARVIFLWHHGWLPKQLDHINRDRYDDRIENLRAVTPSENQWNREVKGYCFDKRKCSWKAMISVHGKAIYLGNFDTEQKARRAYLRAKRLYHSIPPATRTGRRV